LGEMSTFPLSLSPRATAALLKDITGTGMRRTHTAAVKCGRGVEPGTPPDFASAVESPSGPNDVPPAVTGPGREQLLY
jgi:hypothetical protein